jgi:hypothetical protein
MARLEGRSHEFTLVAVELSFATENAIANGWSEGSMDCYAFVKVISMFDQNALDVLWFVEQDAGKWSKMHTVDVTCPSHALKEAQAIFGEVG